LQVTLSPVFFAPLLVNHHGKGWFPETAVVKGYFITSVKSLLKCSFYSDVEGGKKEQFFSPWQFVS
jgi:hypothetical protein